MLDTILSIGDETVGVWRIPWQSTVNVAMIKLGLIWYTVSSKRCRLLANALKEDFPVGWESSMHYWRTRSFLCNWWVTLALTFVRLQHE